MPEVPIRRTVLAPSDAEFLLRQVWPQAPEGVLRLLLALWDLETAGGKRMWNHNWGNIVATTDARAAGVPYYIAEDTGRTRAFRSYDSVILGAQAFVVQLTRDSRAHWRAGLFSGNPATFAKQLRIPPAYYEASLSRYTGTLTRRWRKYAHLDSNDIPGPGARPSTRKSSGATLFAVTILATVGATIAQVLLRRGARRGL